MRPRNEWHLLDPDVLYWLIQTMPQAEFVETLLTVRRVFEPAAAALAAKVASDESAARHRRGLRRHGSRRARPSSCSSPTWRFTDGSPRPPTTTCWPTSATCCRWRCASRSSCAASTRTRHALSLPRHKAILTALLHRDPQAAHQASLLQLKETREDITEILEAEAGLDLR